MVKDKTFYNNLFFLTLPLVIQEIINFCVQMLDTVMVGMLGDEAISAVTLASQPYFIYNTLVFGITSGGAVIISQYYGKRDMERIRKTVSLMIVMVMLVSFTYLLLCRSIPELIMSIFSEDASLIERGKGYLSTVALSYVLTGLNGCFAATLNAKGNTRVSAFANTVSFFVNMAANYAFIFGRLGAPALGVVGAAVGTIIARTVQLLITGFYFIFKENEIDFRFRDLLHPDMSLFPGYMKVVLPVMGDDFVWSLYASAQLAIIGHLSTSYVASASIANVAQQFTLIFIFAIARAAGIVVGQSVGEGDREHTLKVGRTFLVLSLFFGIFASLTMLGVKEPVLLLYPNVSLEGKMLAKEIMNVIAGIMVLAGAEATLIVGVMRGAGDLQFSFWVDTACMWLIAIPMGYLAAFVWKLPVVWVYLCLRSDIFLKIIICIIRVLRGRYIRDLTIQ